jgi:hypothetical protein
MRMLRQAEALSDEISAHASDIITAVRSNGVQLSLLQPEDPQGILGKIADQQDKRLKLFVHALLFERLVDRRIVLAALQMFYEGSSDQHCNWARDEYSLLAHCCREHALQTERDTMLESLLALTQNR